MKNKKILPIIGIILGALIGILIEFPMWKYVGRSEAEWITISLSAKPSGGVSFGPGIAIIMTSTLFGLLGVLVNIIYGMLRDKK